MTNMQLPAAAAAAVSAVAADLPGHSEPPQLVTPLRYGIVQPKLYRGMYPRRLNLPFLRRLKLKTILSVTPEPLTEDIQQFCREQKIAMIHVSTGQAGQKPSKKGVPVTYEVVVQVLQIILSEDNAPLYLHCLNGSRVTSLVVACLRKLSFWRISSIFSEFLYYSEITAADHKFVENFRAEIEVPKKLVPWVWMGLSRSGVVDHHPTLKIKPAAEDDAPAGGDDRACTAGEMFPATTGVGTRPPVDRLRSSPAVSVHLDDAPLATPPRSPVVYACDAGCDTVCAHTPPPLSGVPENRTVTAVSAL
ncbi:tyrosine phosphatase family-domain-containing protein [Dipodascopsis tothii]|uniref:tyrosine phosphatase family-domain-containing protein n=1 Tax=Dipodascopsis tothii TaxID=44089 RepID=UPI0034D01685